MDLTPPRSQPKKLITLTPLIDVVFILLLFFMLSSSFVTWRSLEFATASPGGQVTSETKSVLLRAIGTDEFALAGSRYSRAELPDALQTVKAKGVDNVLVEVSEDLELQVLVDVLDLLADSEIPNFGLSTQ
ncbi:MAG: biopolymer transporter ExbD [Pseudomonadota bacterium]